MAFETETAFLLIIARMLHLGISLGLFGTMVSGLVFDRPTIHRGPVIWLIVGMGLSGALWLWCVAASLASGWQDGLDPTLIADVLTETWFGRIWFWRLVVISILFAAALAYRPNVGRGIGWPGAAILMLSGASLILLALTGHAAMGEGWPGWAHRLNHGTHLVATACWLGGLGPLGRVLRDAQRGLVPVDQAIAALSRFSHMGMAAVFAVLSSGLVNFFILTEGDLSVLTTPWGMILSGKLLLVACLLVLALVNRLLLLPHLTVASDRILATLRRTVQAEQGLGLILLALVSWLGTTAPSL